MGFGGDKMTIGTVITIFSHMAIVLDLNGDCALCLWADGRQEWVFLPNHIGQTLEVIV